MRDPSPDAASLAAMTSAEVVAAVLEHHPLFKDAGALLAGRAPDEDTGRVLVAAYSDGRAPAWLAAYLLGCLRARSAYAVVRGILLAEQGSLSESYAGVALVRLAGADARADLLDLMRNAPRRVSREGAAYGLGSLGDATVAAALLAAVRDGKVLASCAGSVLASLPVRPGELVALLEADEESARAVAIQAVFSLSAQVGGLRDAPLARAARAALRARRVRLSPRVAAMLEERIARLLGED